MSNKKHPIEDRSIAINTLNSLHQRDKQRVLNGWQWVTNGDVTKMVSPSKLKLSLLSGYRVIDGSHLE